MRKTFPQTAVTLAAIGCLLVTACTPPPTHKEASARLSVDQAAAAVAAWVIEHAGSDRPVRLAVVAFAPTQERLAEHNAFGAFFAEKTTSALVRASSTVRLFERDLLEKIAQENALELSGVIDTREATRIGEFAPIDWILTGTYTVFDEYIAIDGRLLQVVSGEILAAIGSPAVPVLKEAFLDARTSVKIRIVKILASMGTHAKEHIPYLRARMAAAENDHLRDALEDALFLLEREAR